MRNIPTISWCELPGNKFSKALNSAMYSSEGYVATQNIRKKGEIKGTVCTVIYDRDYLLEWFASKVVRPLSPRGKENIHKLIDEAGNIYHGVKQKDDDDYQIAS